MMSSLFTEKKDYVALLAFILLLVVIVLANLSQSKDTNKFLSRQTPGEDLDAEEADKSDAEEIRELMSTNLPSVANYAQPVKIDLSELETFVFSQEAVLNDVTEGKTLNGITTGAEATGYAKAILKDNNYFLLAKFQDTPDPSDGNYYEGWVVRKEPFRYESTGKVEKINNTYTNIFGSTKDLLDHDFFVLTLEKDDGNPAPSDHILEGKMFRK